MTSMTAPVGFRNSGNLFARIQVQNRQRQFKIHRNSVVLFCAELLQSLGVAQEEVSVVFVGARTMRALNRRYRRKDYPTDVLSFSYGTIESDQASFLGEIVIAPDIAVRNAARWGINPEKELRKLLVHGILHLLGYDHETDRGRMNRMQKKLVRRKWFGHAPSLAELKGIDDRP
jgi:probable rRNA maturation factor